MSDHRKSSRGYEALAAQWRSQWLADWDPGRKLPTYEALRKQFDSTMMTVRRAMDLLSDQGFIVTRPAVGTYLAERPPHERQIGIVFPGHPEEVIRSWLWSRHYLAVLRVAEAQNATQERWRYRFYMDVSPKTGGKGLKRLERDIEAGALAGLAFVYSPHELRGSPLLKKPRVPMVFERVGFPSSGMTVEGDPGHGIDAIANRLRARGCRDVALLTMLAGSPHDRRADIEDAGFRTRPEWIQAISPYHLAWLPNLLRAMFARRDMPDALVITDDHLVEPAVDTLLEMPDIDPETLVIAGKWNFPMPYRGRLPITLFGFDGNAWLAEATELIATHPGPPTESGETRRLPIRYEEAGRPASLRETATWEPIDRILEEARTTLELAAV